MECIERRARSQGAAAGRSGPPGRASRAVRRPLDVLEAGGDPGGAGQPGRAHARGSVRRARARRGMAVGPAAGVPLRPGARQPAEHGGVRAERGEPAVPGSPPGESGGGGDGGRPWEAERGRAGRDWCGASGVAVKTAGRSTRARGLPTDRKSRGSPPRARGTAGPFARGTTTSHDRSFSRDPGAALDRNAHVAGMSRMRRHPGPR